jgi:hypothetical protein
MSEDNDTPWPFMVELNGHKYRRLLAATTPTGGIWEYCKQGRWHKVQSVFLKQDLNDKAKKETGRSQ